MIVPSQESEEGDNYRANPKTHQVLGQINGVDYVEGQIIAIRMGNGRWIPDGASRRDLLRPLRLWSISILEPKDSTLKTDIGHPVKKSLDAAMKKESHDKEMSGDAGPYFRCGAGRKLRVRSLSQNNPSNSKRENLLSAVSGDIRS